MESKMIKRTEDVVIVSVVPYCGHFKIYWTNVWFGRIRRGKEKILKDYESARKFYQKKKQQGAKVK
jgi:hypothetical protein